MIKKALFTFSSVVIVLAIAGCDNSTPAPTGNSATLPEGIEPFTPPEPGEIPAVERPGAAHSKTSTSGE